MILEVLQYGHPVLRQKGARIESVTLSIRKLIADMIETMNAHKGVGLAAQQIGQALQLTVVDVSAAVDRPSSLEVDGKSVEVGNYMPLTLLNPEVMPEGDSVAGPEGCLSFPEVFADISRPVSVAVKAMNEAGKRIEFRCGGLLARAVQHEVDHLNGILFIDRMDRKTKSELRAQLEELQAATKAQLQRAKK